MNLMQKINEVMKRVAYVQKTKDVGTGRYAYKVATYDQVIAAVREHFVEAGIVIVTRQIGSGKLVPTGQFYGASDGKTGTEALRYEALYEIDFINIEDPNDKCTVPVEAHAIDQGDKAPGKAQTYATKAAIKKVLLLESGDDEESRASISGHEEADTNTTERSPVRQPQEKAKPDNGEKATEGEIAFLKRKLEASGKKEADLLKSLGIETLDGLTKAKWEEGKALITKRAA